MTGPKVPRRPGLVALVVVLTACGSGSATSPEVPAGVGFQAACAAPEIEMASPVRAGERVEVTITDFFDGCPDTAEGDTATPVLDADVVFQQNGRSAIVGTASASGPDFLVRTTVDIPGWAGPGTATVASGPAAPVTVQIVA